MIFFKVLCIKQIQYHEVNDATTSRIERHQFLKSGSIHNKGGQIYLNSAEI